MDIHLNIALQLLFFFFPRALPQTRHRLLSLKGPKEQHGGGKATPYLEENKIYAYGKNREVKVTKRSTTGKALSL